MHAQTTREGGVSTGGRASLNLGVGSGDYPDAVRENRRRVLEALGFPALVNPYQVHGRRVAEVTSTDDRPGQADAVATDRPGVLLGVLGADCPCVLVVDPVRRALALVHSGWRGTAAGVVPAAVGFLAERYGSRPTDLLAGIGAGISGARYEVGPEVVDGVRAAGAPDGALARGRGDRYHVDLGAVLGAQLVASGVRANAIERVPGCTVDDRDLFFSHRRDGAECGRHALVAGWTIPARP